MQNKIFLRKLLNIIIFSRGFAKITRLFLFLCKYILSWKITHYFVQKHQSQAATRICSCHKHISAKVSMKQKFLQKSAQSSMSSRYFHKNGSLLTSLISLRKSQHLLFLRKCSLKFSWGFRGNFLNIPNFRIFLQVIFLSLCRCRYSYSGEYCN
jgi:hypothetical protein